MSAMTRTNALGQPIGEPVPDWTPPPHPPRREMAGRFCRLEPLDPGGHLEGLWEAYRLDKSGSGWTYLNYGPFASYDDYATWGAAAAASRDPLFFTVRRLPDAAPVGVAAYLRIAPAVGTIEVGHLHFSPLLQRTPAATEAMFLMMERAFGLGYRRYEWKCDALNAPSCAAAERLGLSFEGVFRQALVYKGRNRDTAWYAAIDKEWPALRTTFEAWLAPENFTPDGRQIRRLRG
jgi:RimJ/RimL family protein N-acetyltransferase